jgi:hypothetical protein
MNPYLEQNDAWNDFHDRFLPVVAGVLGSQVLPRYFVKIEERLYVHELPPAVDFERQSCLEIRDRRNRQVVTTLELLSPTNKRHGPNRAQYEAERNQLLASPVHFVEIDLLRGRPHLPLQDLPECDYYALVSRAEGRPQADVWPLCLRDRLPVIPVPLHSGEKEPMIDLQQVLDRIYDAAGYEVYIYAGQPDPPLTPEEAEWARQFVPQHS